MAMVGSITRGEVMGTPGTKIEWMTESTWDSSQLTNDEQPASDEFIADYADLIRNQAFIGEYPIDAIKEGITDQFDDYINIEDHTNYLDVFYTQMHTSRNAVSLDDGEEHPTEITEALDGIQEEFINFMADMFRDRFTITIADIEEGSMHSPDNEFILRRLYEFFILGAKNNFKAVIAADILPKVQNIQDDREYFRRVQELVDLNSPLITSVGPMDFLKLRNDVEIIEMFENGKIAGNFLRKYSPKFYQNEEFLVEVINHITMIQQFKTDLVNSTEDFEKSNVSPETKMVVEKTIEDYLKIVRADSMQANQ